MDTKDYMKKSHYLNESYVPLFQAERKEQSKLKTKVAKKGESDNL